MDGIVTVSERKRREAERRRLAAERVMEDLRAYVREHPGGRFIIFGSVARGDVRFQSDMDVIADFPHEIAHSAMTYLEESCSRHGVDLDLFPGYMTKREFIERALRDGVVIG